MMGQFCCFRTKRPFYDPQPSASQLLLMHWNHPYQQNTTPPPTLTVPLTALTSLQTSLYIILLSLIQPGSLSLSDGLMVRWCVWCPCAKGTHLSQLASRCDCLGRTDNTWGGVSSALLVWVCFQRGRVCDGPTKGHKAFWATSSSGFVFVLFTLSKHLCGPSGSICVYNLYYHTSSLMCVEEPSPVACMVIACMCVCLFVCVLRLFFSSQLYFILYPHFIAISYKILKQFFFIGNCRWCWRWSRLSIEIKNAEPIHYHIVSTQQVSVASYIY